MPGWPVTGWQVCTRSCRKGLPGGLCAASPTSCFKTRSLWSRHVKREWLSSGFRTPAAGSEAGVVILKPQRHDGRLAFVSPGTLDISSLFRFR